MSVNALAISPLGGGITANLLFKKMQSKIKKRFFDRICYYFTPFRLKGKFLNKETYNEKLQKCFNN